jgi:hypothetical protein
VNDKRTNACRLFVLKNVDDGMDLGGCFEAVPPGSMFVVMRTTADASAQADFRMCELFDANRLSFTCFSSRVTSTVVQYSCTDGNLPGFSKYVHPSKYSYCERTHFVVYQVSNMHQGTAVACSS